MLSKNMVLITINGKGARFKSVGIDTPKFMLEVDGKSIIQAILENLKKGFNNSLICSIGLNEDYKRYSGYIKNLMNELGITHSLFILPDSKGQADTVRMLIELVKLKNFNFWVMNCDTIVSSSWNMKQKSEIVVEVFNSELNCYSYIDDIRNVRRIAEKKVISNFASTGNYYFNDSEKFLELFKATNYQKEIFISDVINQAVKFKYTITGNLINKKDVLVLGTPEQYNDELQRTNS